MHEDSRCDGTLGKRNKLDYQLRELILDLHPKNFAELAGIIIKMQINFFGHGF
jgi:hypothetical protein